MKRTPSPDDMPHFLDFIAGMAKSVEIFNTSPQIQSDEILIILNDKDKLKELNEAIDQEQKQFKEKNSKTSVTVGETEIVRL